MSKSSKMIRRAGWLFLAAPFFGVSTGALFPLVALELNRLGFGEAFVGSVTSLYYAGSMMGALTYGWVLNRVGYKIAFLFMAMLAGLAAFALTQFHDPSMWLVLRFIGGYALGGYYIVVDSWVSALGTRATRGRLFAGFETLRLLATAIGPSLIIVGATTTSFVTVAIVYSVSFVPALLNDAPSPKAKASRLSGGLAGLAQCFPFALAVAFCGGIANASFYGLSAVYANALGYNAVQIALFVGIVLVAPAVIAIPVGALADRFGRMPVALLIAGLSVLACVFVSLVQPTSFWTVTAASVVAGGCLVPLYVLGLSRIVDAVGEQDVILATTAGLLSYNAGALCGPVAAGFAMERIGPTGLYVFLGVVASVATLLAVADMYLSRCCPEGPEMAHV
jgi:MFS family permease